MGALDRWRALTEDERRLTVVSVAVVAVVAAALPFVSTARLLRAASVPVRTGSTRARPEAWIAATDRAARYVPGATCLAKSIALAWMLRRRGVEVVVKIGARAGTSFSAHAWIERDGLPLTAAEAGSRRFTIVLSSEKLRAGR